jgi:hypothetical protein
MAGYRLAMFLGGIGGMMPTFCKIAASFAAEPEQALPHPHIGIGLVLFFVIGAVCCAAFNKDNDLSRALIIWVSGPGLITNIVSGATTSGVAGKPPVPGISRPAGSRQEQSSLLDQLYFITSANAADPVTQRPPPQPSPPSAQPAPVTPPLIASESSQTRPLEITTKTTDPAGEFGIFNVAVVVSDVTPGGVSYLATLPGDGKTRISVPLDIKRLQVKAGGEVRYVDLPDENTTALEKVDIAVDLAPTIEGDIVWGLGGKRTLYVAKLAASPVAQPAPEP